MHAIEILNADRVFDNGVRALAGVALTVDRGEFVSLIGPSGCGKSTLLRLVAGLLAPTSGEIRVTPERPSSEGPRVAFVFQAPTLMAWAKVDANVALPLRLARVDARSANSRVDAALAKVGLLEFRRAHPRELSGGMQMRVSIARALVTLPSLLLMDEPFAALDEITRARLDRELSGLAARDALTVLFVTHSIYEAVFLSTRVVVMSARPGRIFGEVAIDVPQPRAEAFRASGEFSGYCARLHALLAEAAEANVAIAAEA